MKVYKIWSFLVFSIFFTFYSNAVSIKKVNQQRYNKEIERVYDYFYGTEVIERLKGVVETGILDLSCLNLSNWEVDKFLTKIIVFSDWTVVGGVKSIDLRGNRLWREPEFVKYLKNLEEFSWE